MKNSPPLLTHILPAARHEITSWWGSVCCEPAMNFSSWCPVNFHPIPCSLSYLLFHVSFFPFIPSSAPPNMRCLSPPDMFCSSKWCCGFISLFTDGELILHTLLEPKPLSSFQTNRNRSVSPCLRERCKFWKLETNITGKIKQLDSIFHLPPPHTHTHAHAERLVMTPSNLLPFDVWPLCEWRASRGLVDLWPSDVYLVDGRGTRALEWGERIDSFNLKNRFNEFICQ